MKTLAMLKMEKNFIAHIEKNYPRKPYQAYDLNTLINRFIDESIELLDTVEKDDYENAKQECADISNIIDYIFERLTLLTNPY